MKNISEIIDDYLAWAPTSLVVREVSRIKAVREIFAQCGVNEQTRVLDVGCGDGRWWQYLEPVKMKNVVGIDIAAEEIKLAAALFPAYCLDVSAADFAEKLSATNFDLVIGNCSLEHIFDLEMALRNIYRQTAAAGYFAAVMPSPRWAFSGRMANWLHKISPRLAMSFSGLLNGFFQHWHLYNHKIWRDLARAKK